MQRRSFFTNFLIGIAGLAIPGRYLLKSKPALMIDDFPECGRSHLTNFYHELLNSPYVKQTSHSTIQKYIQPEKIISWSSSGNDYSILYENKRKTKIQLNRKNGVCQTIVKG